MLRLALAFTITVTAADYSPIAAYVPASDVNKKRRPGFEVVLTVSLHGHPDHPVGRASAFLSFGILLESHLDSLNDH